MKAVLDLLPAIIWTMLWAAGGWLLSALLFRLHRGESALVGFGLGLTLQVSTANILARILPVPISFWIASAVVLVAGLGAAFRFRRVLRIEIEWSPWVLLGLLTLLFNSIGRGLGVFDDYQNLPTVSLMATGDIPPHFALNPTLSFGYHYFLLLFCAELMRLGNLYPWSALDLGRALLLALPLVLAGMWGYRLTRSRFAAALTGFVVAFAGGARWLLLLLPPAALQIISANVTLIGSAASTAPTLAQALLSDWKIDGAAPIPFPFAFYTGINQPYIMAYTGIAGSGILIMLLLLLTARRWQHWSGALVSLVLVGSLAIANEISFLLIGFGFVVVVLAWLVQSHRASDARDLAAWVGVLGGGLLLASLQGGLLTDVLGGTLHRGATTSPSSYFDATPILVWPPAVISAHLGSLSVLNLPQLIAALLEIGPVILITPLLLARGLRCLRSGRWFEASLLAASFGALPALFLAFRGPLFTATPRLMSAWFFACTLYAVPLTWNWLRARSDGWKIGVTALGTVSCLGGLVLLGAQLSAIQEPIYATFITPMDAKMTQELWNRLPVGGWIFDPLVYRAPTVFGRFTDSSPSWYSRDANWQALDDAPDPFKLRAAGYSYAYFDGDYWNGLTSAQQLAFTASCVQQVAQVDGIHSDKNYTKDFRRLLDIRACR